MGYNTIETGLQTVLISNVSGMTSYLVRKGDDALFAYMQQNNKSTGIILDYGGMSRVGGEFTGETIMWNIIVNIFVEFSSTIETNIRTIIDDFVDAVVKNPTLNSTAMVGRLISGEPTIVYKRNQKTYALLPFIVEAMENL